MKPDFIKINVNGGILSIGELKKLVDIVRGFDVANLHIGERQDLYFHFDLSYQGLIIEKLNETGFKYEFGTEKFPNIVSSYASQGIFTNHPWMGEGLYQDILNSFDYTPKLRINLTDPAQSLVPLFTGDVNFLPSHKENYFHVYLADRAKKNVLSPNWLVYGSDVATICRLIEEKGLATVVPEANTYFRLWEAEFRLNLLPNEKKINVPRHRFPYYVGMNKGEVDHWLGIYRRNNDFPVDFLASLCEVSAASGIGQINLTAWRSILIKGIKENDRILWETILSRHGINTRYSFNELNWQLPNRDSEALRIKNDLARNFTDRDIRTFGLTFAIVTDESPEINSSVVIYKKGTLPFNGIFKGLSTFDIFITDNFQPNGLTYNLYEKNVPWSGLAMRLRYLSRKYFDKIAETAQPIPKPTVTKEPVKKAGLRFQCTDCFTVYDEQTGDPLADIAPLTKFRDLPASYCCQLCGAGKEKFEMVEVNVGLLTHP